MAIESRTWLSSTTGKNTITINGDEEIRVVDDPSGTPVSGKVTIDAIVNYANATYLTQAEGDAAYQPLDADLTTLGAGGSGARDFLDLGTSDSPQFTGVELGHATDTTLSRLAAGSMAVEGQPVKYKEAAVFRPRDYLSAADWTAAQNYDTASQSASAVTAALQSMHDAMMTWVKAGNQRVAIADYGAAGFAINDELFSATWYSNMWSQTNLGATKSFGFIGAGDRSTKFICKSFVSPVITRAAGPWSGLTAHRAVFPIHINPAAFRCSFVLDGFEIVGEESIETDPVGVSTIGMLDSYYENISIDSLSNVGWFQVGGFNSRINELSLQTVGLQPTSGGEINGARSGFPANYASSAITCTLTDLGGNQVQIDTTASYFTADHASNGDKLFIRNGRSVSGTFEPLVVTISAYTSTTRVTADYEAGTTINATSGLNQSFGILTGSVSGTTLTLDYPLDLGTEVGRHLFLPKAGSPINTGFDLLVARITAISGDKKTITLSHAAANVVSDIPVIVAPSFYAGFPDDVSSLLSLTGESYFPNDVQFDQCRFEHSAGYISPETSSVSMIWQGSRICGMDRGKTHGASMDRGNFGAGAINAIFDDSEIDCGAHQFTWGNWNDTWGSVWLMGERSKVALPGGRLAQWRMHNKEAVFYVDPQGSSQQKTALMIGGFMEAGHHNLFPNASQALVRYGSNGSARMVYAIGPLVSETEVLSASTPPVRSPVAAAISSSGTAAVLYPLRSEVRSTGTPANGIGSGVAFDVETTAGNIETGATLEAVTTDITAGSEDFDVVLKTMIAGAAAAERVRVSSAAAGTNLTITGAISGVSSGTADASDTASLLLQGGGSAITNPRSRGAHIQAYGNEHASNAGDLVLHGGNVSTGDVKMQYGASVDGFAVTGAGNAVVGSAALATTATNGFLYIPTCPGTPTGVPTTITGRAPIIVDSTNNKLYFYSGGAWRDAGP